MWQLTRSQCLSKGMGEKNITKKQHFSLTKAAIGKGTPNISVSTDPKL